MGAEPDAANEGESLESTAVDDSGKPIPQPKPDDPMGKERDAPVESPVPQKERDAPVESPVSQKPVSKAIRALQAKGAEIEAAEAVAEDASEDGAQPLSLEVVDQLAPAMYLSATAAGLAVAAMAAMASRR